MSDLPDFLRFLIHSQDRPKDEALRLFLVAGFALLALIAAAITAAALA
ncbi:hypothetical protein ACFWA9_10250 [Kitasatospora sp. NPDC059973]